MRKALLALVVAALAIVAHGQTVVTQGSPTSAIRNRGAFYVDSILRVPIRDTFNWMGEFGSLTIRPLDGGLYYRASGVWRKVAYIGGSGYLVWADTSSLATRAWVAGLGYLASVDSSVYASIYRVDTGKAAIRSSLASHIAADLDIDSTNELQALSFSGGTLFLNRGGGSVVLPTVDTSSLSGRIDARVRYSDTLSMLYPYFRKADTASLSSRIDARVRYMDTSSMLVPYLRKADTASLSSRIDLRLHVDDTAGLSTRINQRVKYTDTSAMLLPYLRKIDTASMSTRIDARLRYTDTATLLSPYVRKSRTITINGTSYDLTADRSWSIPSADSSVYATRYWSNNSFIKNQYATSQIGGFRINGDALVDDGSTANYSYMSSDGIKNKNTIGGRVWTKDMLYWYFGITMLDASTLKSRGYRITPLNDTLPVPSDVLYVQKLPSKSGTFAMLDDIAAATSGVPTTRTLSINGTTYDLSADRSWTIAGSDTSSLSTRINDRVRYTDTASMMAPYLHAADTASLSSRINAKYTFPSGGTASQYVNGTGALATFPTIPTSSDYIQNQTASTQAGGYRINGDGTMRRAYLTGVDGTNAAIISLTTPATAGGFTIGTTSASGAWATVMTTNTTSNTYGNFNIVQGADGYSTAAFWYRASNAAGTGVITSGNLARWSNYNQDKVTFGLNGAITSASLAGTGTRRANVDNTGKITAGEAIPLSGTYSVTAVACAANAQTTLGTSTVTGAAVGDIVEGTQSTSVGIMYKFVVTAANTVTVYAMNNTTASVTLTAQTVKISVVK